MTLNEHIVNKLFRMIDLLNTIEVKGFNNLRNLGFAIQQLDGLIQDIQQEQKNENDQARNKPKES